MTRRDMGRHVAARAAALGAACCVVAPAAAADGQPWVSERLDDEAVQTIWVGIRAKDCAFAVKSLNAGIAKQYPGVLLLAGAMFEDGVCLKSNWPKAVDYYSKAHAAGHPRAAARMASGYLTPAAGPDKAASLWWALRAGTALPWQCADVQPLLDDADRFVAALRAWPASRLDQCGYVAGVVATINGDVEFSSRAAGYGLKGLVRLVYRPAEDGIDVRSLELETIQLPGVVSGYTLSDRESPTVRAEFERDIRASAARAIRRYAKPSGIDPAWAVTIDYRFDLSLR